MYKKIIAIGLLLVMILSLTACGDNGLAEYKTTAKETIETYAEEKGQDNYTTENWTVIQELVLEGKSAVDRVADTAEVDSAVETAKNAIDEITKKEVAMGFYSLQKAYDLGLLTQADIKSIAYHIGKIEYESFAIPKMPTTLSAEVENAIKEAWAVMFRTSGTYLDGTPMFPNATAEDFEITGYYGTYNDCVAVKVADRYTSYMQGRPTDANTDIIIAGVAFNFDFGPSVIIWKMS